MAASFLWYLAEFCRAKWLKSFFAARTAPLATPSHFRDYPLLTDNECTHCLACMMICPAPGAIEVMHRDGEWKPLIHRGHCIRCGLCVEACPEDVLTSGRILEVNRHDNTSFAALFQIDVNHERCLRCSNCAVACPVNKEEDPTLGWTGTGESTEVIMRVMDGELAVINEDKCTGCKTCEQACPNNAIRVARILEGLQEEDVFITTLPSPMFHSRRRRADSTEGSP